MSYQHDEDLFEGTKMTFGEHLDELRAALLKAVLALGVGFVIGLLIGNWVVRWIQMPVEGALQRYYTQQAMEEYVRDLEAQGIEVPDDVSTIEQMMAGERLISESAYVSPSEITKELKRLYPDAMGQVAIPELSPEQVPLRENMIRIFLWRPVAMHPQLQLRTLNAQEAFMIYIKASLIAGFVLASPLVFYYVWNFVAAGLYPHEKRYVHLFMPISIGLFLAGAALAFFVVFRYVLDFLLAFNAWLGLDPDLRISEWLSFVMLLPIGFGISFQLPLVMLFLERIGVIPVQTYIEKWRIAVMTIAIISMILTPADPISMILMAVPLTILYFGGIAMCRLMPRGRNPFAEALD